MKFLCLHGAGTNSQIFEMQSAALRYDLGDYHTYDWAEGTVRAEMAPEIRDTFPADDQFFEYFEQGSPESYRNALNQLDEYIAAEGPFDGVIGFSQGAGLAANHIARKCKQGSKDGDDSGFKCAIFIGCGYPIIDYDALCEGKVRKLSADTDGELIAIPTAHIWGERDDKWGPASSQLATLCRSSLKSVYQHPGGHEVPGSGATGREAVARTVNVMRRAIETATMLQ
ncbi:serine hydrolase FSH [Xylariales sp. PMI_506]|nr:serine hydrolase FSH [Xylariales sp. PMI_506]